MTESTVSKIAIIAHIDDALKVFSKITTLNVFHPDNTDKFSHPLEFEIGEKIASLLIRLGGIKDEMKTYFHGEIKKTKIPSLNELLIEAESELEQVNESVGGLFESKRRLLSKKKLIDKNLGLLSNFKENEGFKAFFVSGKMPAKFMAQFKSTLNLRLPGSIFLSCPGESGWDYILVGVSNLKIFEDTVSKFTWVQLQLPDVSGTVEEFRDILKQQKVDVNETIKVTNTSLKSLAKKSYPKIVQIEEMLRNYYRVLGLSKYAKRSEYAFILEGWVLKKNFKKLSNELKKIEGLKLVHEKFNVKNAPAYPDHPPILDPFYSIASLMGPTSQGSMDPTFSISFFFPLFFGMMLGDIGYGALLILVSLLFGKTINKVLMKSLGKPFSKFNRVLLLSGISSILFGYFFGEFFGSVFSPLLFNRLNSIDTLIWSSLVLGIIHTNLGLLFKMVQDLGKGTSFLLGNVSWFLTQFGVFLIFVHQSLGLIILLISLAILWKFKGASEIFLVVNLFSNFFSYVRLAAIGLSSIGIAIVVNQLAGIVGAFGIFVLIFGHSLNFIIGVFVPFIQATRLHLIEFFTKFYETSDRVFNPVCLTNKYTGGDLTW